ncbi:GntR family transcriptional regulator [Microbacterium luticocti]|uniref:GntR family transcriptional regulator n=1 Tax=Microbacterium luticocti TaxID=451764 RepID=UPI00048FBD8C|nr:GntR family transcriptional regulator [Microbacterium luticocti]
MTPKYLRVLRELSARIDTMNPGDPLPSEEELSREFGTSPMTTRRALTILLDAKRIVGIRGKGTFVAQQPMVRSLSLKSFSESMKSVGRTAHSQILELSMSPADAEVAAELEVDEGAQTYLIRRLRFGDDLPIAVDRTRLPAERFPGLLGKDLTGSLYATLSEQYGVAIERATSSVRAVAIGSDEAELLHLPEGTPCLAVRARAQDSEGRMIESTLSLYRGDMYELHVDHIR